MFRGMLVTTGWIVICAAHMGCGGGECGEGTVRFGDTCLAVDPFDKTPPVVTVDPPEHTREVGNVRLKTDEPATIYYTIDGSIPTLESANEPDEVVIPGVPDDAVLRYFAIDRAGNQSAEESRVWIIDREGPAGPLDFRVALAGTSRTVTWTNPPDSRFGGVMIARVEGPLTFGPNPGQRYVAGDVLGPSVTVVAVTGADDATLFNETLATPPGMVRYVGWAFDEVANYGPPSGDHVLVPIPAQAAQVLVTASNGEVRVVTPASHIGLSGVAVLDGTTLKVELSLRNDTTRVLFAPKLALMNLPAVEWANPDGTVETQPYRAYGAAILPATSAVATWEFSNASAGTVLLLDLVFRDNPVLASTFRGEASSGEVVDAVTGLEVLRRGVGPRGPGGSSNGKAMTPGGGITPDGRLVVGARTAGNVTSFDLVTGAAVLSTELLPQKSHVPTVVLDRGGTTAYALVANLHPRGAYQNGNGIATELVRLDTATLTEHGRIPLESSRNRSMAISPDGRTLIIATGLTTRGVIVVDLGTFTIKRRIVASFRVQSALFSVDGASIVAVGEEIAIHDAQTGVGSVVHATPGTEGKVMRAAFGQPDVLWIGRRDEVASIHLGTGAVVLTTATSGRVLEVFDGAVYAGDGQQIERLDFEGVVMDTVPGFSFSTNSRGHWLGRSPF